MKSLRLLLPIVFSLVPSALRAADETATTFKMRGQIRMEHTHSETTVSQGSKDDVKSSTGGFSLNRARLVPEGTLGNSVSYRMKVFIDRTQYYDDSATGSFDPVERGLVEAKLVDKWCDFFSLEIGRLEVASFSVESNYSSMDSYSPSQTLLNRKPGSANGISLDNTFAGQDLNIQIVNSPGYDIDGTKTYRTLNDDVTVSAYWYGHLMGDTIKPLVSFVNARRHNYDAATKVISSGYNAQYTGIGSSFIAGDLTIELERDTYQNPAYAHNADFDVKTGKASALAYIGQLRYSIKPANLLAIAKVSLDDEKFEDDAKKDEIKTNKYSVAAEWRPHANQFRYHANIEKAKAVTTKENIDDITANSLTYLVGAAASIP